MNFSDPLLVSQGQDADKIKIRLLKDYFLQASPVLAQKYGRSLVKLEEDNEYIIIIEDIPV